MAGQIWSVNALGGFMFAPELSNVLRMSVLPVVKFRQFCDAKDATDKGLQRGDTYSFNVYSRAQTKGAPLNETNAMPETNFIITQKSVTMTEYGNSVPFTQKLDNLSQHPVQEIIHRVLKHDCKQALDIQAWAQFNSTGLKVNSSDTAATAGASIVISSSPGTGSIGVVNNCPFAKGHLRLIVDNMKERNIPAFIGDDYYCIARPTTFTYIKGSDPANPQLEQTYQYTETGFGMIMNGEIGRFYNMRFVEQTHIPKGGAENFTTFNPQTDTPQPWSNNKSDWIFFFGEDTVAEAIAIPEEIRGKIPTDYGRSKGIAWYALLGYGRTQGDKTADDFPNSRILKWESQT
jgi:N4-gp56 family major capsid protein